MNYTTIGRLFFILMALLLGIEANAQCIIDTIPPSVKLRGLDTVHLAVHHSYKDFGVDVSDNYTSEAELRNGNILETTDLDTSKPGIYHYTYLVADKCNNKAPLLSRTIIVIDTIAPVIKLKGMPVYTVCRCCEYNDVGYTITDNVDTADSISVIKEGSFVDAGGTSMDGIFMLRYVATDKAGNKGYSEPRYIQIKSSGFPCSSNDVAGQGVCCTSVGDESDKTTNRLTVFPNITNGSTNMIWSNSNSGPAQYRIITVTGQTIKEGMLIPGQLTSIDLSGNAPGSYWIICLQNGIAAMKQLQLVK